MPSAKTASTKLASNAKPIKSQITNPASSAGAPATTPTTPTASVAGPPKKRIPVPSARRPGPQSRQPKSDIELKRFKFYFMLSSAT